MLWKVVSRYNTALVDRWALLHAFRSSETLLSDPEAQEACNNYIAQRASNGLRSLGVAVSHDGGNSMELAGLISLLDPPRSDSAATIKRAQEMGIQVGHRSLGFSLGRTQ